MSTTPPKASAEQWEQCASALIERLSRLEEGHDELAARVEALEREAAVNELRAASAEARPAPTSSLVERVAEAIYRNGPGDDFEEEARAAIREIAAWLVDRGGYPWAWVAQILEQEVDRG